MATIGSETKMPALMKGSPLVILPDKRVTCMTPRVSMAYSAG